MGFQADLKFGQHYQELFLDYLEFNEYDELEFPQGNFKPYDLLVRRGSKTTTYEIKADRLAQRTGNLCIEYECNKKASGISTTTADAWGYFIVKDGQEPDCYIIPTDAIRSLMNTFQSRNVGDGWRSKARLIPISTFAYYKVQKKSMEEQGFHTI